MQVITCGETAKSNSLYLLAINTSPAELELKNTIHSAGL
jgi:hypothetical protein